MFKITINPLGVLNSKRVFSFSINFQIPKQVRKDRNIPFLIASFLILANFYNILGFKP